MNEGTALRAVMTADIHDFSSRMARDEDGVIRLLLDFYYAVAERQVAAQGGRLFRKEGDAVWCVFESASAAVRAAIAIQGEVLVRNLTVAETAKVGLRVGIDLGEVTLTADGDVLGHTLSVAKRLETACDPGAILVSDEVHRQVVGKDLGFAWVDRGGIELRGVGPVRAFQGTPTLEEIKRLEAGTGVRRPAPARAPARPMLALGAVAAVLVAVALGVVLPRGGAKNEARRLLEADQPAAAYALLAAHLEDAPGDAVAIELAIRAAGAEVDRLAKDDPEAALRWLRAERKARPELAPLDSRFPSLAREAGAAAMEKAQGRSRQWAELRDFVDRFPDDPDVPWESAFLIHPEEPSPAWLMAAVTKGHPLDRAVVWNAIRLRLEDARLCVALEEEHPFAKAHLDAERRAWADETFGSPEWNEVAYVNALWILRDTGDPRMEDPTLAAFLAFMEGKDFERAASVLAKTGDLPTAKRVYDAVFNSRCAELTHVRGYDDATMSVIDGLRARWGSALTAE